MSHMDKVLKEFDEEWNKTSGGFHLTPYEDSEVDPERIKAFLTKNLKPEEVKCSHYSDGYCCRFNVVLEE